jgi:3-oxoacyl-[acyl-carrier protein] reductase
MTKAAVATMVKGIALDLAPRQITVNNVQPGPTETDMTAAMVARLREVIPVGRMGNPTRSRRSSPTLPVPRQAT